MTRNSVAAWLKPLALALGVAATVAGCGGGGDGAGETAGAGRAHTLAASPGAEVPAPDLAIDGSGWQLVGSSRVTRTQFDYTYRAQLVNRGGPAANVRATLSSRSLRTQVIDGSLSFGDVAAGARVRSQDSFTIRHDRSVPFDPASVAWQFSFDPPPTTVALEGPPGALAIDHLLDLPGQRAGPGDLAGHVFLNQLRLVLRDGATVAQVNAAAAKVGGRIVSSRRGSRFLGLLVPRGASVAAVRALSDRLDDQPGLMLSVAAETAAIHQLPTLDAANQPSHLLQSRFPAAWNAARRATQGCGGQPITIVQPDHFGDLPAAYAAFEGQLPPEVFIRDAGPGPLLDSQASPPKAVHGYDVALTMAARHDERAPTGAMPALACLSIHQITLNGWPVEDGLARLVAALRSASGNAIVNASLGYEMPQCGPAGDQDCKVDTVNNRRLAAQTPVRVLRKAILARMLTAVRYAELLNDPAWNERVLFSVSAGNEADHLMGMIYPGLSDARFASSYFLSGHIPWIETAIKDPELWAVRADFRSDPTAGPNEQDANLRPGDHADIVMAINGLPATHRAHIPNRLVVGSAQPDPDESVAPVTSAFSNFTGELNPFALYAVGEGVGSLAGPVQGTSFSAPQVSALAAYLWSLSPALRAAPLVDTIELLRATSLGVRDVRRGFVTGGLIDAYAAVLALDRPGGRMAVRRALLDVNDDGRFDHLDLRLYASAYGLGSTRPPAEPIQRDHGRYDLNGDGYTGGSRETPMDLDAAEYDADGAPVYSPTLPIDGLSTLVYVDERKVTDVQALCYFAYSSLYEGDPAVRQQLLDDSVCGAVKVSVDFPTVVSSPADLTVRVRLNGLVQPAGTFTASVSAVCGSASPASGPVNGQGLFRARVSPNIACGRTLLLTITVRLADGTPVATRLVDAAIAPEQLFFQAGTAVGLRVLLPDFCVYGQPCTYQADDANVALSTGSTTPDGRANPQASVTICRACGGPQELWLHGLNLGESSVTTFAGGRARRFLVKVGKLGIQVGGPSPAQPAVFALNSAKFFTLRSWIEGSSGPAGPYDERFAVRDRDIRVTLQGANTAILAGVAPDVFTEPAGSLLLTPAMTRVALWSRGTAGTAAVELAASEAWTFIAPPTNVVVGR